MRTVLLAGGLACLAVACQPPAPGGSTAASPGGQAAAETPAVAEARALVDQGQPDAALQRLQGAPPDAESYYQQGRAWARKAESAPAPAASGPPASSTAAPEFKVEEQRAIEMFEKAVGLKADHAKAHQALAQILAPHAVRRFDLERPPSPHPTHRRGAPPVAPPSLPDTGGIDVSAGRVIREFQLGVQGDPSPTAVDPLIAFGARVDRLDAADAGFRELLQRVKESATPLIRYGDFLLTQKKDPEAAIEQYRQALIWKPDDEATRQKIVDIYLTRGAEYYSRQEYAMADAQFKQAEKYVVDRNSEAARKLQGYQAKMREIRGR
jgi:tetratricopeptide (TPR) repeat protein